MELLESHDYDIIFLTDYQNDDFWITDALRPHYSKGLSNCILSVKLELKKYLQFQGALIFFMFDSN